MHLNFASSAGHVGTGKMISVKWLARPPGNETPPVNESRYILGTKPEREERPYDIELLRNLYFMLN